MTQGISQRSTTNSTTGGLATAATALASFNDRVGLVIQNQAATPLFVKFGAGCTTSVYDRVLSAGTLAADGTGGILNQMSGTVYTGIITVASATTPSYTAVDF